MTRIEEPGRQLDFLQECLSSDKRPLGLFLGAGCPMAVDGAGDDKIPLIPGIEGITDLVRGYLAECEDCGPLLKIVEGHFEKDGRTSSNVEDMLTHVRALRAIAGKDEARGLSSGDLELIEDRICDRIHLIVDQTLPDTGTPYHSIASWAGDIRRDKPVEIFTPNYDLLIEQAFEASRVPYFDGFAGVLKPFFDLRAMEEDTLPPRWARLWKLHGSINWYEIPERGVFRGTTQDATGSRRVIHPSHLKYRESRRMPYLAMSDRLRAFLKQPEATLVLCGYSFRDQHINEAITHGLESTQNAIAFALQHDVFGHYEQAVALASAHANLILLALDGGVIGRQAFAWPERDQEAVSGDDARWVDWVPNDSMNAFAARFKLGDFAVFGQFLQEIVGSVQLPQEQVDA